MAEIIAILCLGGGVILLAMLSAVDLKQGLLPNKLVLAFALCGLAFHAVTLFVFIAPADMIAGALLGGGLLYAIRFFAQRFYAQDALGLGDVKLLAAAGLWLGTDGVLSALVAGSLAGVAHGLGIAAYERVKTRKFPPLNSLSLPAGPGFAAGIVLAAAFELRNFPAWISS